MHTTKFVKKTFLKKILTGALNKAGILLILFSLYTAPVCQASPAWSEQNPGLPNDESERQIWIADEPLSPCKPILNKKKKFKSKQEHDWGERRWVI
jgi:hypothetical protein